MNWILGILGTTIAGLVAAWLTGAFQQLAPSPAGTILLCREWVVDLVYLVKKPVSDSFTIIMTVLEGDDKDQTHTFAVIRALGGQSGVHLQIMRRTLRPRQLDSRGQIGVHRDGEKWLKRRGADLLIWGDVTNAGNSISLSFISAHSLSLFSLPTVFNLKGNVVEGFFNDVAAAQISAMALSSIEPVHDFTQRHLVKTLIPIVARLKSLVVEFPDLTSVQRRDLYLAAGRALKVIAENSSNPVVRDEAISIFRDSLPEIDRQTEGRLWAQTEANLANSLAQRGSATLNLEDLENALTAYQRALEETKQEEEPLEWADMKLNFGNALCSLGEITAEKKFVDQGMAAYRSTMKVRTQDTFPVHWAFTNSNLASALLNLAANDLRPSRILDAVSLYNSCLTAVERNKAPMVWAMIHNNIGASLLTLDERQPQVAHIHAAITHFNEALEEWISDDVPLRWAALKINLGEALRRLGERIGDATQFEEAEEAYTMALQEATPERDIQIWAKAQKGLANVLVKIAERQLVQGPLESVILRFDPNRASGDAVVASVNWVSRQQELQTGVTQLEDRERGIQRLETAIRILKQTIERFARERDPTLWAVLHLDLSNALIRLGEQADGTALFSDALAAAEVSLQEWSRRTCPLFWALSKATSGRALMRIGEREGNPEKLKSAIVELNYVLEIEERAGRTIEIATLHNNIGITLLRLSEMSPGISEVDEAIKHFQASICAYRSASTTELARVPEGNMNIATTLKDSRDSNL